MKMGLLAMATLPLPLLAMVRFPTLTTSGWNERPSRLRFCPMKMGLLAMAILPLPERAIARLPTLMVLGQPQMLLPKRLRQDQSSLRSRPGQNQTSSRAWPSRVQCPVSMTMGLLAMAILPLPELATVRLPTLMRLGQNQERLPKRLRQRQLSLWLRSGHAQTPLLMNIGLLTTATLPEPEAAMVRLPTPIRFGQNQMPWWLRLCQNQLSLPDRLGQDQSPLLMKTGLLTTARLPVLRSVVANQSPARLRSRCTNLLSARLPSGGKTQTPSPASTWLAATAELPVLAGAARRRS